MEEGAGVGVGPGRFVTASRAVRGRGEVWGSLLLAVGPGGKCQVRGTEIGPITVLHHWLLNARFYERMRAVATVFLFEARRLVSVRRRLPGTCNLQAFEEMFKRALYSWLARSLCLSLDSAWKVGWHHNQGTYTLHDKTVNSFREWPRVYQPWLWVTSCLVNVIPDKEAGSGVNPL